MNLGKKKQLVKKQLVKKHLTKRHIKIGIGIISVCIVALIIIYITQSKEGFDNSRRRPPFLYKERYECNKPHLIPAFSPEICCRMVNGKLKCDHKRNCRCKNKRTGICETCYPKMKKRK